MKKVQKKPVNKRKKAMSADLKAYERLNLKKPKESDDYEKCSAFVVQSIEMIMKESIDLGKNKITINTNL